jgi:Cu/Ag efflux pump CusA
MGDIFKAGAGNADAKAIDEIYHYVLTTCAGGRKIPAYRIINFAKARVPLHSVERVITVMEKSGMLRQAGLDPKNKNVVLYQPGVPAGSDDMIEAFIPEVLTGGKA